MISRCSSPIPAISVCPLSGSVRTRNDGSSVASFCSDVPSLSWSALVLGSMAMSITGSGNSIRSSTMGWCSSQSVSPVVVSLSPTAAAMSPASTSSISSRLSARICTSRPIRSRFPLAGFQAAIPVSSRPE